MRLVDEIIEMASDGKQPLADALRKCLILAFDLKNEKLKEWTEKELNGFETGDETIPNYRKVHLHSKGNFTGPGGAWLPQRPLPEGVIDKKHRQMLVSRLVQPIAAYDIVGKLGKKNDAVINWSPSLIAHYQEKFIEGFALAQAWQEVPASLMVGLCEEVRNRLLRFALEIREELGRAEDKPSAVPVEKIEAAVINHIYGGVNVIAGTAKDFTQIGNIVVSKGDFSGLAAALKKLEVSDAEIGLLKQAIDADGKSGAAGLGQKTRYWLQNIGSKLGSAGVKIGTAAAQELAKEWLLQFCGLK